MENNVVEKVKEIIAPLLNTIGAQALDITFKREGPNVVLRIFLDKPEGVTLDECARVNRFLDIELETLNIIDGKYIIEVASPGLDRPLKRFEDYIRSIGKEIRVTTFAPVDNKHELVGTLVGLSQNSIVIIDKEGISSEIPFDKIASAKLYVTC